MCVPQTAAKRSGSKGVRSMNPLRLAQCGLLSAGAIASLVGLITWARTPPPMPPAPPQVYVPPGWETRPVWNYEYNPKIVPSLKGLPVEPNKRYILTDQSGRCIGTANNLTAYLIHHNPTACDEFTTPQPTTNPTIQPATTAQTTTQ